MILRQTLAQKIEICDVHLLRIHQALEHIRPLYPFSAELFPITKYEDLTSLELFTTRFAKLQDYMGESLFPDYLRYLEENIGVLSMIDRLNKLEKYGIVENVTQWKELRDLRNYLVHEYPDSFGTIADTLNQMIEKYDILEKTLNRIKNDYAART